MTKLLLEKVENQFQLVPQTPVEEVFDKRSVQCLMTCDSTGRHTSSINMTTQSSGLEKVYEATNVRRFQQKEKACQF